MKVRSALFSYLTLRLGDIVRRKGAEYAVDHLCDSFGFMAAGIVERLHNGRSNSCSAGYRHRGGAGQSDYRTQTDVAVSTRKASQKGRLNA